MELSPYNLQRMLLTAVMVSCKMFDDIYYSNKHWAEIGELTAKEMKNLEFKLLGLLNFNCRVLPEEYQQFVHSLESQPRLLAAPHELLRPLPAAQSRQLTVSMSHCSPAPSVASSVMSDLTVASSNASSYKANSSAESAERYRSFEMQSTVTEREAAATGASSSSFRANSVSSSMSKARTQRAESSSASATSHTSVATGAASSGPSLEKPSVRPSPEQLHRGVANSPGKEKSRFIKGFSLPRIGIVQDAIARIKLLR